LPVFVSIAAITTPSLPGQSSGGAPFPVTQGSMAAEEPGMEKDDQCSHACGPFQERTEEQPHWVRMHFPQRLPHGT
jgi:hypothetical protein